ncbi:hypothetical protein JCM11251_007427 [Rhodosporidiobolus azoricus]
MVFSQVASVSSLSAPPTSSRSAAPPPAQQPQTQGPQQKRPRRRVPQLSGGWRPDLPSAGGKGRGCGHFVWGKPELRAKVAAFDLDGTVIRPLNGQSFPQNAADWEWCGPTVTRKLRDTYKAGYAILLISNQASHMPKLSADFKRKLPVVCRKLNVPLHAFAAWEFDEHRKSATGMWDTYEEISRKKGVEIDHSQSFYVGDAAGRPTDHADTDRKFAFNSNLPFLTPEEFFDGEPPDDNWAMWGWSPLAWDHSVPHAPPLFSASCPSPSSALGEYDGPEIVVLVGSPAVGKTTWFERELAGRGFERKTYSSPKPPPAFLDDLKSRLDAYHASNSSSAASSSSTSALQDGTAELSPAPATLPSVLLPSAGALSSSSPSSPHPPPKIALEAPFSSRFSRRAILGQLKHLFPSSFPSLSSTSTSEHPKLPRMRVTCMHFTAPVDLGRHNSIFRAGESKCSDAGEGKGKGKGVQVVDAGEFKRWEREWEEPTLEEGFHSIRPVHFRFSPHPASPSSTSSSPEETAAALSRWNRFLLDVYPGKQWKTGRLAVAGPGWQGSVGKT